MNSDAKIPPKFLNLYYKETRMIQPLQIMIRHMNIMMDKRNPNDKKSIRQGSMFIYDLKTKLVRDIPQHNKNHICVPSITGEKLKGAPLRLRMRGLNTLVVLGTEPRASHI